MMVEILEMLLSQKIQSKVIKGFFSRYKDLDEFSYSLEQPLADDNLPIFASKTDVCVPITNVKSNRLKEAMVGSLKQYLPKIQTGKQNYVNYSFIDLRPVNLSNKLRALIMEQRCPEQLDDFKLAKMLVCPPQANYDAAYDQ